MPRWDAQRVAGLAPDAASLAAARKLAKPGPWSDTGCSDVLVWGRCQGSGSTPYRTSVDLTGPAYRCSCPSRKFPCKHALALLLLWSADQVGEGAPDPAAAEWAAGRVAKAKPADPAREASAPDSAARAKRVADRAALMDAGVEELGRWLGDLVRAGIAEARGREGAYWDAAARRAVDAQLPGLGTRIRRLPVLVHRTEPSAALIEVGLLWSLVCAWRRRDELAPDDAASLRAAVGWATPTAEVREADALTGEWTVLGVHRAEEGRLTEQRTWLRSAADGGYLLLLDFAAGGASLPVPRLVGQRIAGTVSRYPGPEPRRALLHDDARPLGDAAGMGRVGTLAQALQSVAAHLTRDTWAARTPIAVDVRFSGTAARPRLADADGVSLPMAADVDPWLLAAVTGGASAAVFGELEEGALRPLSVAVDGALVPL